MFQATHLVGFGVGGADASVSFVTSLVSTSDATAYTFSGASIGTAASGRRIVVGTGTADSGNNSISSVTIGGNAAASLVSVGTVLWPAGLFILQVDTGTTADIVVTFANSTFRCGIGVWAVYDLQSSTATDTGSSVANPATDTLNINAGGVAIGYIFNEHNAAATASWAGLTERFDETVEGGGAPSVHSGASDNFASAQTALSITATPSGSFYGRTMVIASLR